MALNKGYAAYANNRVMTASPGELVLMLYEGAIKFCNIAVTAVEERDIEKAHINIVKVEKIVSELKSSLNPKYEVSQDFDNIYSYLLERLTQANVRKDKEILEEVLKHLRTMRDAWKEVMKDSRTKKSS